MANDPQRLGRYEVLRPLGVGGTADVLLGRLRGHADFERQVVLKCLRPNVARDARMIQAFIDEAKLGSSVQHDNVVQVYELGEHEGDLFIAMEFVDGFDLRDVFLRAAKGDDQLPIWWSVYVVLEVLEALAYAHDLSDTEGHPRNVVHCDVSLDNIFVSRSGDVKLGDFGLARDDARPSDPLAGEVRGKIPYMAPEVFSSDRPDRRADVFSVGVVLWELLTSKRLFVASSDQEAIARVCIGERVPPSTHNRAVPPALDALVLSALAANKDERMPSAADFRDLLTAVLATLHPGVRPADVCGVLWTPAPTYQLIQPGVADRLSDRQVIARIAEAPTEAVADEDDPMVMLMALARPNTAPPRSWAKVPVWLRGFDSPVSPVEALLRLEQMSDDELATAAVSADHENWIPLEMLVDLLGVPLIRCSTTAPDPSWPIGQLKRTLRQWRPTAFIVASRPNGAQTEVLAIEVVDGRLIQDICPRAVFATTARLMTTKMFAAAGLVDAVHSALRQQARIASVLPPSVYERFRQARAVLLRRRAERIFDWSEGSFGFVDRPRLDSGATRA